jgi:ribosomal protein S12 methylthiotransferase
MSAANQPTVAVVSLGCPKNLVDSERMLAMLALDGFVVTGDPDGADVAVVNTCAFIDLARAEADEHIAALEELKAAGRLGCLVVAGCMAQREGAALLERHPAVDAIVGIGDRNALAAVCREVLARHDEEAKQDLPLTLPSPTRGEGTTASAIIHVGPHPACPPDDGERLRLTPRHYAYLRISEGCDNRCAYCAIPEIRGPLRSKPPEQVLAEAAELAADGTRELILIGQDTTAYGKDLAKMGSDPISLARLLAALRERVQVDWIRVMYTHPASFGDDVIAELAKGLPVVPYVDLPLQHISDAILASMGRRTTRAEIERLIARIRAAVPDAALRTSLIVGYPGETQDVFEELVGFVREVRFDHVGVFVYSPEPGTRAATMPDQVPGKLKRKRWEKLMRVAETLAHESARQQIGRTLTVRVDGPAHVPGKLAARHAGQAPDVDAVVLLPNGAAEIGQTLTVRIVGAREYDLVGKR